MGSVQPSLDLTNDSGGQTPLEGHTAWERGCDTRTFHQFLVMTLINCHQRL